MPPWKQYGVEALAKPPMAVTSINMNSPLLEFANQSFKVMWFLVGMCR